MALTKMDIRNNQIHKLEGKNNVDKLISAITQSGVQEDAFFVLDIRDLVNKYKQWVEKLPRVKPYYAVKCNDSTMVLGILSSLGCSFDCASKGEIKKIMDLGVDSNRIIFAQATKAASHIRYASTAGVQLMTFDNESELHKIKSLHPTAKLILRIRCDATVVKNAMLGLKHGCNALVEAPKLLQVASNLKLDIVGISFHVGSGCEEANSYARGIAIASDLFKLGKEIGFEMNVLDIGGGFPGDKDTSINEMAEVINEALDLYFPENEEVFVMSEPGRYFVSSAFTLSTYIISKRKVLDGVTGDVLRNMYYINDGAYGSFNAILYDNMLPVPIPLSKTDSEELIQSTIWGPTCDSLDLVSDDTLLPDLNVGEWIIFENMGAYTYSGACSFNGFPIPNIYGVIDHSTMSFLKNLRPADGQLTLGEWASSLSNINSPTTINECSNPDVDAFPELYNICNETYSVLSS